MVATGTRGLQFHAERDHFDPRIGALPGAYAGCPCARRGGGTPRGCRGRRRKLARCHRGGGGYRRLLLSGPHAIAWGGGGYLRLPLSALKRSAWSTAESSRRDNAKSMASFSSGGRNATVRLDRGHRAFHPHIE